MTPADKGRPAREGEWRREAPTVEEIKARRAAVGDAWAWHRWPDSEQWIPIALRALYDFGAEWSNGSQWFHVTGQYAIGGEWGGWCEMPSLAPPVARVEGTVTAVSRHGFNGETCTATIQIDGDGAEAFERVRSWWKQRVTIEVKQKGAG